MYKIEISSFWIDMIGKTVLYSVIAIVTFIIAIKMIRVVIRDWHIKNETTVNIAMLILAIIILSITFKTLYAILNIWGILEISVV
jgi:hypothetical protein